MQERVTVPQCMRCVAELFSDEYDSESQYDRSEVIMFGKRSKISRLLTPRTPRSSIEKAEQLRGLSPSDWPKKIRLDKSRISQKSYRSSGSNKNRESRWRLYEQEQEDKFINNEAPFFNTM